VLLRDIEPLLTRPVGRPWNAPVVWYAGFLYQAQSWDRARRVVAKVEWHNGELFPRVGFIVTNLSRPAKRVVRFYNQRAGRSSGSRKARTPLNGPACPVTTLWTTKCGCNCSYWLTTLATSCGKRCGASLPAAVQNQWLRLCRAAAMGVNLWFSVAAAAGARGV